MSILSKSIRSALALSVVGLAAQSASALDISAYDASTVNVYLSGSTAVDGTILNSALALVAPGGLCQSGTVDVYYIGTASSYSNRMIFCSSSSTVTSTAGTLPTGTKLAIFKESNVGSANGVSPLYLTAEGQRQRPELHQSRRDHRYELRHHRDGRRHHQARRLHQPLRLPGNRYGERESDRGLCRRRSGDPAHARPMAPSMRRPHRTYLSSGRHPGPDLDDPLDEERVLRPAGGRGLHLALRFGDERALPLPRGSRLDPERQHRLLEPARGHLPGGRQRVSLPARLRVGHRGLVRVRVAQPSAAAVSRRRASCPKTAPTCSRPAAAAACAAASGLLPGRQHHPVLRAGHHDAGSARAEYPGHRGRQPVRHRHQQCRADGVQPLRRERLLPRR